MNNKDFFRKPNLPDRSAACVMMSDRLPDCCAELRNNYGIEILTPSPLSAVTGSERFHADMSICHLGGNRFISSADNTEINDRLCSCGADVHLCSSITAKLPLLNVCFLGGKVICNTKKTSDEILSFCENEGIGILHTNQSYAKCSVAVATENAVITSDEVIARLCEKNGIDCLCIEKGYIELDGYDYGFIGGCCGLISPDLLVFTGDICSHPSYREIRAFAASYGVKIQPLGNNLLYDVGGILPIF